MHQVFDYGISIKWADYGFAGHERCSGPRVGDKMVLPRVVLCTRFLTMEFLFSGRTMVLPGMSDALALGCSGCAMRWLLGRG